MKLVMESWRRYLLTEAHGPEGGIIFGPQPEKPTWAIIGVSHGKDLPPRPDMDEETKTRFANIIDVPPPITFYCEGNCDDAGKLVPWLSEIFGSEAISLSEPQVFDSFEDIRAKLKPWEFGNPAVTSGKYFSTEWPLEILKARAEQAAVGPGKIPGDEWKEFLTLKKVSAADIIKLMLIAFQFGPTSRSDHGSASLLEAGDADIVLHKMAQSGIPVHKIPGEQTAGALKQVAELAFPAGADVANEGSELGKMAKRWNDVRDDILLEKINKTGGIALIGYSHLVKIQNRGLGKIE